MASPHMDASPSLPTQQQQQPARITLRHPSTTSTPSPSPAALTPPPLSWLSGSWNVTHSTLPMWKKSRNVRITYTLLCSTNTSGAGTGAAGGGTHIDDEVSYQPVDKNKSKVSTVRGVDKPFSTTATAGGSASEEELASWGYNWRGKGWLMIASSKWEILGYGAETSSASATPDAGNDWVVTYFAKTLFTPAGVDIYSRRGQLQTETVTAIREAIKGLGGDVARLGGEVFEVAWDGEREGKA